MTANQLALGPVVLAAVFTWNLALTRQLSALPGKIQRDLPPTIVNGWKFWVPMSCINFALVPLQLQVTAPRGLHPPDATRSRTRRYDKAWRNASIGLVWWAQGIGL